MSKEADTVKKLDEVINALPVERRQRIESRTLELSELKDLRFRAELTQQDLALALGVRQDTISRLEKRSDMLVSTLRDYVECMGGTLELVARFPGRPPMLIDPRGVNRRTAKRTPKSPAKRTATGRPRGVAR